MVQVIHGVVSDRDGVPVPLARVHLAGGPGSYPDISALTDRAGRFSLSAPLPGTYRVQCVADGFAASVRDVAVEEGHDSHLQIGLEPTP